MNGIQSFLEVLAASGIEHIFANPGTTELPLNDALVQDTRLNYHLALHEIPAVGMADGYSMASGKVGVVNLHIACGLGNAMGMIYNAHVEGTPLLLTAGQQDSRLALSEPVLWGNLVEVARPWTKWSYEVHRAEDIAPATRRAIQTALTPPTGPVFLSLPVDFQTSTLPDTTTRLTEQLRATPISSRIRPDSAALDRVATGLLATDSPVILAGSRVANGPDGPKLLAQLAELLGCDVITEATSSHGRLPISPAHACYGGRLPLWASDVRRLLEPFDTILAVGLNLFRLYIEDDHHASPLDPSKSWFHVDSNAHELAKNFGMDEAVLGDLDATLRELVSQVQTSRNVDQELLAKKRADRKRAQDEWSAAADRAMSSAPMTSDVLMHAVIQSLPSDAAIVEEAVTTHNNRFEFCGVPVNPHRLFAHRGWALGWGIGCSLGVQLAWPDVPVLALIGDGAALYGLQGLWTAANQGLPVVFVICNNRQYKILKDCTLRMPLPNAHQGDFVGMDLAQPNIDFVQLSESMGVSATRVETGKELSRAVERGFAQRRPYLIEAIYGE